MKISSMASARVEKAAGTERARDQADLLVKQAISHLTVFGEAANGLRQAAEFVIARHS